MNARRTLAMAFLSMIGLLFACASSNHSCASQTDCSEDQVCAYRIGSCEARGECVARPDGPDCDAIENLCACNGDGTVGTGCGFPDDYANGPTTGTRGTGRCSDAAATDAS